MTFEEFLVNADEHFRYVRNTTDPDYRKGQAFFNYLHWGAERYEISNTVRGTDLDPFHADHVLPDFLLFVKDNW